MPAPRPVGENALARFVRLLSQMDKELCDPSVNLFKVVIYGDSSGHFELVDINAEDAEEIYEFRDISQALVFLEASPKDRLLMVRR